MSTLRAESAARKLLRRWRIKRPQEIIVEDLAYLCKAVVVDEELEGAEARLARVGKRSVITISTSVREPTRRRFDIAHELGHLHLHPESNMLGICTKQDIDTPDWFAKTDAAKRELEASAFAAELLMPRALFEPHCKDATPSLKLIEELAETFNTSLSATARRFMDCTDERCAVVFSVDGRIKSMKRTQDFDYWIPVGDPLSPSSLAADYFEGKELPTWAESVDASAWLARPPSDDAVIKEESRAQPRYSTVLSLLWLEGLPEADAEDWDDSETFTPDGRYRRKD